MHSSLIFARTLCGHYSNRDQAQQDPAKFAHINIYFVPLPWDVFKAPGFYSEQSYDHDPWRPYRQGVHRLRRQTEHLHVVENYGLSQPERVAGAPQHPALLNEIQSDKLTSRCGCAMHFRTIDNGSYQGEVEPGKQCKIPRDGRLTYLISEVNVDQTHWSSRDRGFDPETDQLVWGSEHGMLYFSRIASLGKHLNESWLAGLDD